MKAARALLGWNQTQLGARSGTSMHTVRMFERSGRAGKLYGRADEVDAIAAVRATLEAAGVEFIDGAAPGVRLR